MRIATFNANSVRARLETVLGWMDEKKADVLCLQETKVVDGDFPLEAFRARGLHVVFRGEKSYNGVAVVSRRKPSEARFGLDDGRPPDETRLVYARFGRLHVVNTYVPQGREIDHAMYRYKLEWLARLKAYFARHFTTRMSVLWLGDLNVAPQAIDIHNAEQQQNHVCFHVDVRKAFAETCAWGFVDVFRKYHPEPEQYTFFDYRTPHAARRHMGWRIDHLLATPPLAGRCRDAFIDIEPRLRDKPSDHTFLAGDFDL